jgi:diguanylate cyclase (GGDEF)-like protein/PAS domain S-box-containing protein
MTHRVARLSIRTQLFLLVLLFAICMVGIVSWQLFAESGQAKEAAYTKVKLLADTTAANLDLFFRENAEVLRGLAARPLVRAADAKHCDSFIGEYVALHPEFATFTQRDLAGNSICSLTPSPFTREQINAFPWFQQALLSEGFVVGDAFQRRATGRWATALTYPLRDAAGTKSGLIILPLDLLTLNKQLLGTLAKNAAVLVLDRQQKTVFRSTDLESWVGKSSSTEIVEKTRIQQEGFLTAIGSNGRTRLYAFVTVPVVGWHVVASVPEEEVLADFNQMLTRSIILGLFLLFLILVLAWKISSSILKPINALAGTAVRIAAGDTAARAQLDGPAETKTVAEQFNHMLDVRQHDERELRESEQRFRDVAEATGGFVWETDLEIRFTYLSERVESVYGYSPEEMLGRKPAEFMPPGELDRVNAWLADNRLANGSFRNLEQRTVTKHGKIIWQMVSRVPMRDAGGNVTGYRGTGVDITERKQAEADLARKKYELSDFIEHGNVGLHWVGLDGIIMWANQAELDLLGYTREEYIGHSIAKFHVDQSAIQDMLESLNRGETLKNYEARMLCKDGSTRHVLINSSAFREDGKLVHSRCFTHDITEQKAAEERLLQMAHYDSLTNLPNRTWFYDTLKRTLVQAAEGRWSIAVLFVDLDRFKNVNDTLGHAVGDELLCQVAARLVKCVRVRDVVGRLGGDEFGLILTHLENPDDAGIVASKIIETVAHMFTLDQRETFVTASIGITLSPEDGSDADTLIRFADTAMYRAKDRGRNTYQFYTAEMNVRAEEKLDLENALRRALERDEFLLHYQPKLDLRTHKVGGVEALLRWQRPGIGLVSPADFIPLLEETGLIVPVGEWVVRAACRQIRTWRDAGLGSVNVAVNLSGRQFFQKDLSSKIVHAAEEFGIEPGLIELEITESSLMSQAKETISILHKMKAAGFRLAVDDFGTGYSSLSYLKRFPIDTLKIDRSFVRDIPGDADDTGIVQAILSMAHTLKLSVVAEGVETSEQLEFLRSLGCDEVQGYYFARPMDSEALAKLLRERS